MKTIDPGTAFLQMNNCNWRGQNLDELKKERERARREDPESVPNRSVKLVFIPMGGAARKFGQRFPGGR